MSKKSIEKLSVEYYDLQDSENICFLCNQPTYKLKYKVKHFGFDFTFKQCSCGVVKQTPMPNEKFFEWFFNSKAFYSAKKSGKKEIWGFYDYFKDEPCRLATSRHRYKKLKFVFEKDKPLEIMKVGPSTGSFLYVANQHGHHAIGCDISADFVDFAKEQYNVRIDNGRFERIKYSDEQFDVLLLFNVIENIPNLDEFLKEVNRTVKKGGYFILNHVDMKGNLIAALQKDKYFIYRPPICYIFDRDVLSSMLFKYGFKVVKTYRDIRYLHMEKVLTLLRWKRVNSLFRLFNAHRIPFKIYAYPSQVVVAQKM